LFAILFSMGEKSDAVVTKYSIFRGRILLEYTIIINGISYYHFAKTQGFKRKYMSSGCANQAPKDGDNITALYLKENPAINCVWLQKLDDLYNLRKK
jgi:hypothetical protein